MPPLQRAVSTPSSVRSSSVASSVSSLASSAASSLSARSFISADDIDMDPGDSKRASSASASPAVGSALSSASSSASAPSAEPSGLDDDEDAAVLREFGLSSASAKGGMFFSQSPSRSTNSNGSNDGGSGSAGNSGNWSPSAEFKLKGGAGSFAALDAADDEDRRHASRGCVAVFGGNDDASDPSQELYLLDLDTYTWSQAREDFSSVA